MATLKLSMLAWLRDRDFYNPEKFAAFAAALKRDADVVFPVPKPVPQAVSSASSTAGGTHTSANAHASADAATHGSDSERASELDDDSLCAAADAVEGGDPVDPTVRSFREVCLAVEPYKRRLAITPGKPGSACVHGQDGKHATLCIARQPQTSYLKEGLTVLLHKSGANWKHVDGGRATAFTTGQCFARLGPRGVALTQRGEQPMKAMTDAACTDHNSHYGGVDKVTWGDDQDRLAMLTLWLCKATLAELLQVNHD